MTGEYLNDIKQSEAISLFYKNSVGSSFTAGIIGLLTSLFAFFIGLQLFFIKKRIFSTKYSGSIFINFIIILILVSILIFVELLNYSELKVSEDMILHLPELRHFFIILILTSLVIFLIVTTSFKDLIFKKIHTKDKL